MATADITITIAQTNPLVGDVPGNVAKMRETYLEAVAAGSALVIFPELSVTGCPLEDLAGQPDLLAAAVAGLGILAAATRDKQTVLVAGAPIKRGDGSYSAVAVLRNGVREDPVMPVAIGDIRIGVMLGDYSRTPEAAKEHAAAGANLLAAIGADPYVPGGFAARVADASDRARENGLPFLWVNTVGGQDETVYDGGSFLVNAGGDRVLQLPQWEECVMECPVSPLPSPIAEQGYPDTLESLYRAMLLALGDYAGKTGFTDVILGLSGGMDSALVAALAGDALGPEHVHCLRLPSRHTSDLSNDAAEEMCRAWGFSMDTVPIGPVVEAAEAQTASLASPSGFKRLTLENMQARARGFLLMTVSNERGWLLLSTGNKSEAAAGYATLYGDMCGGYNPIKDVYKTTVYSLARWRNRFRPAGLKGPGGVVIPESIIAREPSAELSPGQKDSDSLPPYNVLDPILEELLGNQTPLKDIARKGFDPKTVARVLSMAQRSEFKRRQGAPGPKLTGGLKRMPMANGFDPARAADMEK